MTFSADGLLVALRGALVFAGAAGLALGGGEPLATIWINAPTSRKAVR